MQSSPEPGKKTFNINVLRRIYAFAAPYRNKFYLSFFLSLLLAVMSPLRPFLIQLTLKEGLTHSAKGVILSGVGSFIIEMTLIQLVLLLLESFARFYFIYTTASLGQNVVRDLRNTTFAKILNLNVRQFDTTPIGTLTTRTINDVESVNEIFSDGFIPILADLLSIIAILSYMFYTDWAITLVCLLPFPFLIIATYFFKESVNKSFVMVRNAIASLNAFVQEHLSGMAVIQYFAAEKRELEKFKAINASHRKANIKAIFAYSVFFPFVELVSAVSIGLLVWWTARSTSLSNGMTPEELAGVITSFILCINLLFRPLRMLADKFNVLQMGIIAAERIFKVLDNNDVMPIEKSVSVEEQSLQKLSGAIEFKDVSFAYKDQQVLNKISFEISAGQTVALVGNTGSGKTTIVSLLNKLYPYYTGDIRIDGKDINSMSLSSLRKEIAVVLQDVFLFNGTVRDNITLRNPQITEEVLCRATKAIGIHEYIMRLPGGYDFNVMERGTTLSMGQRQLLSFARAVLYNPSILILDEATSSVDVESEMLIQKAIDTLVAGRTAVVIAHRLSTIRKANLILVLDKGEIIEKGTHEELLSKKGRYFELHNSQFAAK
jgi:ATP-binding cassette subfamily B multidrug efflux pump